MPTCWSPTVIVPRRVAGSALDATLKETLPSPCPLVELASWIQAPEADALHWHSRLVETANVPPPPEAEKDDGLAAAVTAHFTVEGEVTFWVDEPHAPAHAEATDTTNASTTRRI
jgi:hypothetical protein